MNTAAATTPDMLDRSARLLDGAFFAYNPRLLATVSASVLRMVDRTFPAIGGPSDAHVVRDALAPMGFGLPPAHALLASSRLRKLAADMRAA